MLKHGRGNDGLGVLAVAACVLEQGFGSAPRGLDEALARGVLAYELEYGTVVLGNFIDELRVAVAMIGWSVVHFQRLKRYGGGSVAPHIDGVGHNDGLGGILAEGLLDAPEGPAGRLAASEVAHTQPPLRSIVGHVVVILREGHGQLLGAGIGQVACSAAGAEKHLDAVARDLLGYGLVIVVEAFLHRAGDFHLAPASRFDSIRGDSACKRTE